ncbi:hypothetical protein [Candidatus Nitrosotenuis cloacae]|uniref:Roadblock/LAMTOR2 domain-containing protein n=1 Tax=Candidatus Nitrosotenuis cloacae TaxID=1603555 RepID=A0A3G1B1H8_9ARCH|nr:hypothetical protein [Candidatus Nitrosotenuis cloacae]AJZ75492.1 hypothetical protein SU86_002845 [Candidatus Nitrosotenuis cloacae]
MEVQQAAERLMSLSPSIRVVTICDLNGKVLFTERSRRVKLLLSKQESRMSLQSAARAWKVRKKLERKLGACKYVVAEYGNVKRITMPAGKNHLFFITTTSAYDHKKVVNKVRTFR